MAYGAVPPPPKPSGPLSARIYPISSRASSQSRAAVLTIPFDFAAGAQISPQLESKLFSVFQGEVEDGRTYPQEGPLTLEAFRSYFLSYDLIVGILLPLSLTSKLLPSSSFSTSQHQLTIPALGLPTSPLQLASIGIQTPSSLDDIFPNWDHSYAFSYYIKPNYPGRSSHLCNAGFVVPTQTRGLGLGGIAGRSFLSYGPRCGYRGSVFNLVYETNEASVKIWERLGFNKVGKIPKAGRLKKEDGKGELYVDAWIIHADFDLLGQQDPVEGEIKASEAITEAAKIESSN